MQLASQQHCGACGQKFQVNDYLMEQRVLGVNGSEDYTRLVHPVCIGASPEQVEKGVAAGFIMKVLG